MYWKIPLFYDILNECKNMHCIKKQERRESMIVELEAIKSELPGLKGRLKEAGESL